MPATARILRRAKITNVVGNNKEVVIIDAPILQNGAGRDAQREKLVTQEAPPATSTPQASRKGLSTEGAYTVKLTNLSIAILIALGTVACGGSDNNSGNNNPPADPPHRSQNRKPRLRTTAKKTAKSLTPPKPTSLMAGTSARTAPSADYNTSAAKAPTTTASITRTNPRPPPRCLASPLTNKTRN